MHSTRNYIQYPVINCNLEKNIKKECIYIYVQLSDFAIQQRLAQHLK